MFLKARWDGIVKLKWEDQERSHRASDFGIEDFTFHSPISSAGEFLFQGESERFESGASIGARHRFRNDTSVGLNEACHLGRLQLKTLVQTGSRQSANVGKAQCSILTWC